MRKNEQQEGLINPKVLFGFVKNQEMINAIGICFCDGGGYDGGDDNEQQLKAGNTIGGVILQPGPLENIVPETKEQKGKKMDFNESARRKGKGTYFVG